MRAEDIEKIDRLAVKARALTKADSDDPSASEQKKHLERIHKMARDLHLKMATLDIRSADALEGAYWGDKQWGERFTDTVVQSLRMLSNASALSVESLETESKRPTQKWKRELAADVLEIVRANDIEVKKSNEGEAAKWLRYAFEKAGMNIGDVRDYLGA